jgi:hypothetical protein
MPEGSTPRRARSEGHDMTEEGQLLAGRYRLIRRIGTGAMGVVWQGHDERLHRSVAIKKLLLRPDLPQDKAAEALARCLREGRIAARLQHPNAITVFDVVDEDGVPNLVMEYVPSRSMATAIAEDGPLAPGDAAAIGAHVATALAAAHDAGIVHRDITPGNVLLGEDGSVKLTDFGISQAADDAAMTKTGLVAGTPAYLAPEVAHGGAPTPASDVFSLGATLYTAVEGAPPFGKAPNVLALLHAVAGGEINPPRRSGPLTDVLLALLAADPQARPTAAQAHDLLDAAARRAASDEQVPAPVVATTADAEEAADVDAALIAAPTELVRPQPAPPRTKPASTGRSHKAMAAAGVLVVALAAVGLWLLGGHNSVTPAQDRTPAEGNEHSHTTRTSGPAPVAPAGEPVKADQTRSTTTTPTSRGEAPAAPTSEAVAPAADNTTTAPPAPPTTTDNAEEPTPSVPTTTPPPTSEAATTAPDSVEGP